MPDRAVRDLADRGKNLVGVCPCRHRKNHAHGGYGRIVTPIDRIAPIARQPRPSFLVSQYVAITRFKRHIAFPADIVEMRRRVVLALPPARNLHHAPRTTADNARTQSPPTLALSRPPRPHTARPHYCPPPSRAAVQPS